MRTTWPVLWILPTIGGMAAIAWRIAGREAALIALVLALIGLPAFQQFRPGRIDHHNVQIALSVLVVAATVWSDRLRWTALAAGALTGLALAIGLECLPYLIACGVTFALRYVADRAGAPAAAAYGLALAASAVAAFFVIVGPGHWTRAVCDSIAVNWIALVGIGGLGLAAAGALASPRRGVRLASVLVIGGLAAAVFLAIEPRCLKGPFAMMDPDVWPMWMADVREMQPIMAVLLKNPVSGAAVAIFPVVAVVAALLLLRDDALRRDFAYLAAAGAFIVAFATTLAAVKGYSYALWLGMPLVAVFALRLFRMLRLQSLVPRFALSLLLTPTVLSVGAIGIAHAAGFSDRVTLEHPEHDACLDNASYLPLAHLPAGLIAADLDYGPFLLALTPHRIVAAPYHRLSSGIRAAHWMLASPPDEARRLLAASGVTYVALCGARGPSGLARAVLDASLWGRLRMNDVPSWLEPVAGTAPFAVYRVKS
jgi:hypothetical protein